MAKYIDADKLKKAFDQTSAREDGFYPNNVVDSIPAADVRENVHGRWIIHHEQKNIYGGVTIECAACRTKCVVMRVADENFCRNCGADMRGENND